MELTKQQLKELLPKNPYVDQWHKALSQLLPDYEINTPQRIASFIAQCAHESANFRILTENFYVFHHLRRMLKPLDVNVLKKRNFKDFSMKNKLLKFLVFCMMDKK